MNLTPLPWEGPEEIAFIVTVRNMWAGTRSPEPLFSVRQESRQQVPLPNWDPNAVWSWEPGGRGREVARNCRSRRGRVAVVVTGQGSPAGHAPREWRGGLSVLGEKETGTPGPSLACKWQRCRSWDTRLTRATLKEAPVFRPESGVKGGATTPLGAAPP